MMSNDDRFQPAFTAALLYYRKGAIQRVRLCIIIRTLQAAFSAPGSSVRSPIPGRILVALICLGSTACAHRGRQSPISWPTEVREYLIADTSAFPNDLTVDHDGFVWFTDRLSSRIGRLDPDDGAVHFFPTPSENSSPYGITTAPDGSIWYAGSRSGKLGRIDAVSGDIVEFSVSDSGGGPHAVAISNGRVWFTLRRASQYGWFDPATGEVKLYPFMESRPGLEQGPYSIVSSNDGFLWFAPMLRSMIFRVDEIDGSLTEYSIPEGWARRIAFDPRGYIWYTNYSASHLGRVEVATGRIEELPLIGPSSEPYGIAVDPQGRIWLNASRSGSMVGYHPDIGFRHLRIPTEGAVARGMAVDSQRGRLWIPLSGTHRIGRIDLHVN